MAEPAPRQLILTLYGLYARDEHNWLSVSAVVRLMGDLGVDSAGVRSSISRLKRRGVLQAMKVDGAAGYALSEEALELLREGDVRIFSRQRAVESDGLVMVVFSIPESERDKRHQLRSTPGLHGVRDRVAGGVGGSRPAARRGRADAGAPGPGARSSTCSGLATTGSARCGIGWASGGTCRRSRRSTPSSSPKYAGAHARWKSSEAASRTAFETYVAMLTDWRRLPYLDPGLPLELLPPGWNGSKAAELFADLDALLRTPAREYALTTIHA